MRTLHELGEIWRLFDSQEQRVLGYFSQGIYLKRIRPIRYIYFEDIFGKDQTLPSFYSCALTHFCMSSTNPERIMILPSLAVLFWERFVGKQNRG